MVGSAVVRVEGNAGVRVEGSAGVANGSHRICCVGVGWHRDGGHGEEAKESCRSVVGEGNLVLVRLCCLCKTDGL